VHRKPSTSTWKEPTRQPGCGKAGNPPDAELQGGVASAVALTQGAAEVWVDGGRVGRTHGVHPATNKDLSLATWPSSISTTLSSICTSLPLGLASANSFPLISISDPSFMASCSLLDISTTCG